DLAWEQRPWGAFSTVFSSPDVTVKILRLSPRSAISLQLHERREEFWTLLTPCDGLVRFTINREVLTAEPDKVYHVPRLVIHRITNDSAVDIDILEVIRGK